MTKTFYQFLMTLRNEHRYDEISQFAKNAFFDISFPKQAMDYETLASYFELSVGYLPNMDIFDETWRMYLESKQEVN